MINHIQAILWKQLKDTFKNKEVLIQFVMFPALTIVMESAIEIPGMPEHFFANLFAVMYIGMAPLTSIAAIISEEKEKNTLRVLQLSNVKAMEYFAGNAVYILLACMVGSLVIGVAGGYQGAGLGGFMAIMAVGHMCSIFAGAAIGLVSKSQMVATSISVPVMMIFSFLPMLSMFNENIQKVGKVVYSEQLYLMMNRITEIEVTGESMLILFGNMVCIMLVFVFAYRKQFLHA